MQINAEIRRAIFSCIDGNPPGAGWTKKRRITKNEELRKYEEKEIRYCQACIRR